MKEQNVNTSPEFTFQFSARASIDALLTMIEKAETSIDLELFYLLPDSIGRPVLDALLKKAQAGVMVRILADSMGSLSLGQSMYIEAFKKSKSHVRFFNSLLPFAKHNKSIWYFRNHRRTIIVDGKELMLGSFCIGEPAIDWLEISMNIRYSASIAEAQKVFSETWKKSVRKTFYIGHTTKSSTDCFTYLTQSPLHRRRLMYKLLIDKIKSAQKKIILISPYLIPDRRLMRAIKGARRRKVEVVVLTPAHTDWLTADYARGTYIEHLLHIGVDIYFTPTMLHAKTAIFDHDQAIVGTLNLDNISLRYNYECGIHIDDTSCVEVLIKNIETQIQSKASQLTPIEWSKRGVWVKFMEKVVWPFRKLL